MQLVSRRPTTPSYFRDFAAPVVVPAPDIVGASALTSLRGTMRLGLHRFLEAFEIFLNFLFGIFPE